MGDFNCHTVYTACSFGVGYRSSGNGSRFGVNHRKQGVLVPALKVCSCVLNRSSTVVVLILMCFRNNVLDVINCV